MYLHALARNTIIGLQSFQSTGNLLFVNALDGDANEYLCYCATKYPTYEQLCDLTRNDSNSRTRLLQGQTEMAAIFFTRFFAERKISNATVGLTKLLS